MNKIPQWITQEHLDTAREAAAQKLGAVALDEVRLERYEEGMSVQTLHIGSYVDEAPVLGDARPVHSCPRAA